MQKLSWKREAAAAAGCLMAGAAFAAAGHGPPAPEFYGFAAGAGVAPALVGLEGALPSPPPGTLGQTYLRLTRPVPAAKHPRAGMLDVRAPGASSVSVQWTNPFKLDDELDGFVDARDSSLWHFESPQMIPGVPHIFRVEARYGTSDDDCEVREKYVRLIMGRIAYVSFRDQEQ